jgi:pimeloyl-ACP methyl ester carboxylesterase
LAAAIIAPRNYGFSATDKPGESANMRITRWRFANAPKSTLKHDSISDADFLARIHRNLEKLPYCTPTGTVILLPGWSIAKEFRLGYALDFANHGYRVILVDLRGQGDSSGRYVSFGLIEHEDITQLITALEARGLIAGKLALFGISEGAVIALDTAAEDPRVDAVIAVAPFTSFTTAIRGVGNDFLPLLSNLISRKKLKQGLRLADKRTGLNLAASDPRQRVAHIRAPVLYIAGGDDNIAPPSGVKSLAAATPHARYIELAHYTHLDLAFATGRVAPLALQALHNTLGKSPDSRCLHGPLNASKENRYGFTVTLKYKLGK